jgi:hypothetical protein
MLARHRTGGRRAARGDAAELRSTDRRKGCHQGRPRLVSARVFAGGGAQANLDVHVRPSRALHLMRKRAHDRHSMWVADCRPPHRPSPCSPAMRRMESRIIRAEPPASSADRWAGRWPASGTASTSRCTPIRCWSWARNTLGRSPTADRRRTISRHLYETVRRPYRTRLPDADHGEGTNLRFGKGETRREPDAMISKFPSAEERSTSWRPAEPPAIFQWRCLVGSARRTVRVRSRGRCNKFD